MAGASYNRVVLLGNLTRDPELRYIPSGMAVSDIGLAVNHKYKNHSGESIEEACFVEVTLWGRTAEVANEYLSKGSPVFIEGRLKLDTWETEGQKRSKLKVVCERMQLIGSRGGGNADGAPRSGGQQSRGGARPSGSYDQGGDYGQSDFGQSEFGAPATSKAAANANANSNASPDSFGGAPPDDIPF